VTLGSGPRSQVILIRLFPEYALAESARCAYTMVPSFMNSRYTSSCFRQAENTASSARLAIIGYCLMCFVIEFVRRWPDFPTSCSLCFQRSEAPAAGCNGPAPRPGESCIRVQLGPFRCLLQCFREQAGR